MTITIEMILDAIRAGYPVEVVVNGETYNFIADDDAGKKEGEKK